MNGEAILGIICFVFYAGFMGSGMRLAIGQQEGKPEGWWPLVFYLSVLGLAIFSFLLLAYKP